MWSSYQAHDFLLHIMTLHNAGVDVKGGIEERWKL